MPHDPSPDPTPIELRAAGRGQFTAVAQALGDIARIRIDDDRDDAFWCEVTLTRLDLMKLLAEMR
jgi:hypothetical protein